MWPRLCTVAIGIWLMAAPAVLGYDGSRAADHDRIAGPLLATFACVAIWEATRSLRRVNTLVGGWLLLAPWFLSFPMDATVNSMAAGGVVLALSLIRGRMTHRFAGGWTSLLPGRAVEQPGSR